MNANPKLFVNARFLTQPVSGVQRYAFEVCLQMKKRTPDIVFLTPQAILQNEWFEILQPQIIGTWSGHVWEQIELPHFLSKQPHYLLLNLCNTGPLVATSFALTIHDLSVWNFPQGHKPLFTFWYRFLIPRLARKARQIFTVSQTVKNQLVEKWKLTPEKVSITYNGLSSSVTSYAKTNPSKQKQVLIVGNFSAKKNTLNAVNAFLQSELRHDYMCVVIGQQQQAFTDVEFPRHARVLLHSNVSDDQLWRFYESAEIVMAVSFDEGFGITVLEALHFGCKVLCSDILVYHELYTDYVYFCQHRSVQGMADGLNQLQRMSPARPKDIQTLLEIYNYQRSTDCIVETLLNQKS